MDLRTVLKKIAVIQFVSNEERHKNGLKRLGRGYFEAHRLNPYNPLSYITVVVCVIVGVILFGVVGFWKEADAGNPFKWN